MIDFELSRERVNGYRLGSQGLWPRASDMRTALDRIGWLPSRESAYLGLVARMTGFDRVEFDKTVFERAEFLELDTVRGQSFLVPRAMAAAAIRAPFPAGESHAQEALERAGITPEQRPKIMDAVVEALIEGPLPRKDILRVLKGKDGEMARLSGAPGVLAAVLTLLRLGGRVVRTNISGGLDVGTVVFARTAEVLPEVNVPEVPPEEALRMLCAYYFRTHGPASPADFGWWSGAGRSAAQDAFNSLRPNLEEVRLEGIPFPHYLPPSRLEELLESEVVAKEPVALVPWRDPWLSSHEGRIGRFVNEADLPRIDPGTALPAVLVRGFVAGRWELDLTSNEVRFDWFRRPSEAVEKAARRLGAEMAEFAELELVGTRPLSVAGPAGEVAVYL